MAGLFFAGVSSPTYHTDLAALSDVKMSKYITDDLSIRDEYLVQLSYFSQDGAISFADFEKEFVLASQNVLNFATEQGLPTEYSCLESSRLEVYDVRYEVLNYQRRFTWNNPEVAMVVGLYQHFSKTQRTIIIIADGQTTKETRSTIDHEAAHYWFERLCLEKVSLLDSEGFALAFEKYMGEGR